MAAREDILVQARPATAGVPVTIRTVVGGSAIREVIEQMFIARDPAAGSTTTFEVWVDRSGTGFAGAFNIANERIGGGRPRFFVIDGKKLRLRAGNQIFVVSGANSGVDFNIELTRISAGV